MALSTPSSQQANLAPLSSFSTPSKFSCLRLQWKPKRSGFMVDSKRKGPFLLVVRSVLDNKKPSVNGSGATEPTRFLLERLFAQTQKLEEHISKDQHPPEVAELGIGLAKMESDLQAALTLLKKKEEDVQDAEKKIFLDYDELKHTKEELARREGEIAAASSMQERLEQDLRQANLGLASQAMLIEGLKFGLKERDQKILNSQSALSLKEDEISKMKDDLMRKSEEAANMESELRSKSQHLEEVNAIVTRQEVEIQELQRTIQEKEEALEDIMALQKTEQEKLRVAEANLKEQTADWLVAQEELKTLAEETAKHAGEANQTLEDFGRVKKLLADVRSRLVSSQRALATSRKKMKDQDELLQKQLIELEAERENVVSYTKSLKDAKLEVESERVKLRAAEARNKELERELSLEKELVAELQKELNQERSSLQNAIQDLSSLKEELDRKSTEFAEMKNLLHVKESELVEARLEIQHLKSKQASLQHLLEEKDLELSNAKRTFSVANQEIAELKVLIICKEDQLTQAMSMLKEKEENFQTMKHELEDSKLKFSEAESIVDRIFELTKNLASSVRDEEYDEIVSLPNNSTLKLSSGISEQPADSFKWERKQLETEVEFARESLKAKEMEVLAAQRALTIKDEELKMVVRKLDDKQKELNEMKKEMTQDATELRHLYALVQERIGEKTIGELAIEKLQLEAAQLEVEAATSALHKLTEMSRDLLNKASLSIDADYNIDLILNNSSETSVSFDDDGLAEVENEVAKLSTLTEQLVREAGIVGSVN